MDGPHCCVSCGSTLQADDGHDLCPVCLGPDHLREGLSDAPCMNCSCMPRALRVARLAQLTPDVDRSPAVGAAPSRRLKSRGGAASTAPPKKGARADSALSSKVERLSAELAEMRSFFEAPQSDGVSEGAVPSFQPTPVLDQEDDDLSPDASAFQFFDVFNNSLTDAGDTSMRSILRLALERLQVEVPQQAEMAPASSFFRHGQLPSTFAVPPSEEYLRELHACWRDTSALSRLSADGRALAAMFNAAKAGLDHMPAVEPAIASLIVTPEEALRPSVRCPRPQCRVTDDLLTRTYNAGARAGRLGNSLAHLLFALSASLQGGRAPADSIGLSDAALQAFALLTRELGRMLSLLCQTRRQVWLAQSTLTQVCRKTLRRVPVEPGMLFGPAALEVLERAIQAQETRQKLSSLIRTMPPPARTRGPAPSPRTRPLSRVPPTGDCYRRHVTQQRGVSDFGSVRPPPPEQVRLFPPRHLECNSLETSIMAYRRGRNSIRDSYEEIFPAMGSREVTFRRVVNIVEKGSRMPPLDFQYDRQADDQWYDDPRNYQDSREYHEEGRYPSGDGRYFENDNPGYGNFHRNSPPHRNDDQYAHYPPSRDDLRHQLDLRNSGRGGPYYRNRGRGSAPALRDDHDDYRRRDFYTCARERSPVRREIQTVSSGSKSSSKSFTPDREKSYSHQPRHKPSIPPSQTPSSSKEGSPHSSTSSKEKASASVVESEEVVTASMEPKPTPEKDIKARRLEAIKAKALEIEKNYRQDCETFCTVVKMLVDKEPSLDYLLQAPLDKNLHEIRGRCLDSLKEFIKDINETTEQPIKSEEASGRKALK